MWSTVLLTKLSVTQLVKFHPLWNPKVHNYVHKGPTITPYPQPDAVYTFPPSQHEFTIHITMPYINTKQ